VVQGSQQYALPCTNNATPDTSTITFSVTAQALSPVQTGADLVITDQHWTVNVPGAVADLLRTVTSNAPSVGTSVTVTVSGTNVQPGSITSAPISSSLDLSGAAGSDATGSFDVPPMTFMPTGEGTAVFSLDPTLGISTDIPLDSLGVTVTVACVRSPSASFLTIDTYGPPLPTTTTTRPGGTTATTAKPPAATARTGTLPITGTDSHTLWVELLAGLLMIQVGLLCWTISQRSRFRRTV
jgi:hypothetical protein